MERYNRNYTAFKLYVDNYSSLIENIEDRFCNHEQKLKADKKKMKEAVEIWCNSNPCLAGAGYKIKFDRYCGCSCPCSPGFRVMVNEKDVRNSGFTQLLWLRRGFNGPSNKWIDMQGKHRHG